MTTTTNCALAFSLLATLASASQSVSAQNALNGPTPIANSQPSQLLSAAGVPIEGWVTLRYSVLADGTPTDVRAINIMPPMADPEPLIEAARQWMFSPGTLNGEAIIWHNNESVQVFRAAAGSSELSQAFLESYTAIGAMLEAEEFDDALAENENLLNDHATQLGGIGLALAQRAIIHLGRDDFHSAIGPAQAATDPRVSMLGGADLFVALQIRLRIEAQLGRTKDALETYGRIAEGLGRNDIDINADLGAQLKAAAEDSEFLEVFGRIDDGQWRIDASRRYFYIDKIEGRIQSIDAECDNREFSIEFQAEADYQLPDYFGNCTLFIKGRSGTAFSFIEVLTEAD